MEHPSSCYVELMREAFLREAQIQCIREFPEACDVEKNRGTRRHMDDQDGADLQQLPETRVDFVARSLSITRSRLDHLEGGVAVLARTL